MLLEISQTEISGTVLFIKSQQILYIRGVAAAVVNGNTHKKNDHNHKGCSLLKLCKYIQFIYIYEVRLNCLPAAPSALYIVYLFPLSYLIVIFYLLFSYLNSCIISLGTYTLQTCINEPSIRFAHNTPP